MRYFFHISYDGTNYRGWQRLPGIVSLQETIETALSKIFKKPIEIICCGRTDAQVHAAQFFFHADIEDTWEFDLKFRLNKSLPEDIAIHDIFEVSSRSHARFDAWHRTYDYFIHSYKDPFLKNASACYDITEMDLDLMAKAVALLPLHEDYIAFCRTPLKHEHTVCRVSAAKLYTNPGRDRLRFEISSNRFLKGMIRLLVAKLLDIGRGNLSLEDFEEALKTGKVLPEIPSVFPWGLYLSKVTYRSLNMPTPGYFHPIYTVSDWIEL